MTLKSRVALVRDIPKGSTISYGRLFKAEQDMKVAVISIGYADGFPRRLTNQAIMTINGQRFPQIGRVCMDMCMCDVTGSDVKRGDEVIIFGKGGISAEEVSVMVNTINYEVTCDISRRAHTFYLNR
jgi:alanine racemase